MRLTIYARKHKLADVDHEGLGSIQTGVQARRAFLFAKYGAKANSPLPSGACEKLAKGEEVAL
ncbi:hypothetical protein [Tritonibacter scottomollicae]|uniref:hypothetical protein n=1 Tax=Tritonibacter scottomollicae TaxID=483013 RepID=UPI002942F0EC|nr:hypothetical protein [Tritonibacter scottomollicae]